MATHPFQTPCCYRGGEIDDKVTLAAYEVYREIHGEQKALIEGSCRGGFSYGELIAFLYARAFPKEQWSARADEAFRYLKTKDRR